MHSFSSFIMVRTRAAVRAACHVCALTLIGENGAICSTCDQQCHTRCAYVRKYTVKCVTCMNKTRTEESKAQRECDAMRPYWIAFVSVILIIYMCGALFGYIKTAPLRDQ